MPLSNLDVQRVADEVVKRLRKIDQLELLRPVQVMEILGCGRTHFYQKILTRSDFPKSFTLPPDGKVKVWKRADIEKWVAKEYDY